MRTEPRPEHVEQYRERLSFAISLIAYTLACIIFALAIVTLSVGCAGTLQERTQTGLVVAAEATKLSFAVAEQHYKQRCMVHSAACGKGDEPACETWNRCAAEREAVFARVKAAARALIDLQQILQKHGVVAP